MNFSQIHLLYTKIIFHGVIKNVIWPHRLNNYPYVSLTMLKILSFESKNPAIHATM